VAYLLDTNACIDLMRGKSQVVGRMSSVAPADCAVSTVTSYELYTGVEKCASPQTERAKVDLLLTTIREIPFDAAAAREAGRLRAELEAAGQMIGPYDVLLAGQAMASGMTLVTDNTAEFARITGLSIENWRS
jgi:tRNA(fMet)-specific endonuclease VapC